MKNILARERQGTVLNVRNSPTDPECHSYVTVKIDGETIPRTFSVSKQFRVEHRLHDGARFEWKSFIVPGLNFLLNPVLDVTKPDSQRNRQYHR